MNIKDTPTKSFLLSLLLIFCLPKHDYAQPKHHLFFGQPTPGDTAIKFDLGIKFPDYRKASRVCFSANGAVCYFTVWGAKYAWAKIFVVKYVHGVYTSPVEVSFSKGYKTASPFITDHDNRIYFNSHRDTPIHGNFMDLFYVDRVNNSWSEPTLLPAPFNSQYWDYSYSESNNGDIVFASNRPGGRGHDLYMARKRADNSYSLENLTALNSPSSDFGPFISPDGSYIVFTSERKGRIGTSDLYISFLGSDNSWTHPIDMEIPGSKYGINFKGKFQGGAYITRNGKYLFFNRDGIRWIRTKKLIHQLRGIAFRSAKKEVKVTGTTR